MSRIRSCLAMGVSCGMSCRDVADRYARPVKGLSNSSDWVSDLDLVSLDGVCGYLAAMERRRSDAQAQEVCWR
jgi:hypothetical protein